MTAQNCEEDAADMTVATITAGTAILGAGPHLVAGAGAGATLLRDPHLAVVTTRRTFSHLRGPLQKTGHHHGAHQETGHRPAVSRAEVTSRVL